MTYPYVAGAVLLASDLNTDFAAKTDTAMTQNAQTGTSYSYALTDASKLLSMSNAASNTVLVTKQATVTWVTGTQLRVVNLGAGVTTLVADTGVTINGNVSLKQYQGGELIRTASDVWLFVPTASSSGMDLITPTSVAGSGVTLSGGLVTFTGASAVSVNGCFSATHDNYLISISNSWASTTGQPYLDLRLRLAGTDASGSNYSYVLTQAYTSIAVDTSAFAATLAHITRAGDVNNALGGGNVSVFAPFLAQRTSFVSDNSSPYSNTSMKRTMAGGDHSLATSYDGFTLLPSASTLTGTLRVYGLRNS